MIDLDSLEISKEDEVEDTLVYLVMKKWKIQLLVLGINFSMN